MQKFVFTLIYLSITFVAIAQEGESNFSVGFSYGIGNELSNKDYSYTNQYVKGQLYYSIKKTKQLEFQVLIEPEINFATHQLLNFYFVTPDEVDFEEKRARYTKLKDIKEYVLHIGFIVRKPISKQLSIYALASVGPLITDTQTERLSKGFAFSDVFGLGISCKTKFAILDFRPNLRHNSNAGLQKSNAGFNTLNYEIGILFPL